MSGINGLKQKIDAGLDQRSTLATSKPVIDYSKPFAHLDLEAALSDPDNIAFMQQMEQAERERRDNEIVNNFLKGVDEWTNKQQH